VVEEPKTFSALRESYLKRAQLGIKEKIEKNTAGRTNTNGILGKRQPKILKMKIFGNLR